MVAESSGHLLQRAKEKMRRPDLSEVNVPVIPRDLSSRSHVRESLPPMSVPNLRRTLCRPELTSTSTSWQFPSPRSYKGTAPKASCQSHCRLSHRQPRIARFPPQRTAERQLRQKQPRGMQSLTWGRILSVFKANLARADGIPAHFRKNSTAPGSCESGGLRPIGVFMNWNPETGRIVASV